MVKTRKGRGEKRRREESSSRGDVELSSNSVMAEGATIVISRAPSFLPFSTTYYTKLTCLSPDLPFYSIYSCLLYSIFFKHSHVILQGHSLQYALGNPVIVIYCIVCTIPTAHGIGGKRTETSPMVLYFRFTKVYIREFQPC